jgi:hydrogenase nickel incorporation protein HypA/HybF
MHEVSICEGLLDVIRDQARAQGFTTVRRVTLEIGAFAAVEQEALRFGFDAVMRGTLAEGAVLEILDLPGRALCYDCRKVVVLPNRLSPCPACGGDVLMPQGGDEMRIKTMEVV